jgi:hypothetical protein
MQDCIPWWCCNGVSSTILCVEWKARTKELQEPATVERLVSNEVLLYHICENNPTENFLGKQVGIYIRKISLHLKKF